MSTYRVFKRKPWRKNERGQYVPNSSARKTTIAEGLTIEQARTMCDEHRRDNPRPAPETAGYYNYIYYEFESE